MSEDYYELLMDPGLLSISPEEQEKWDAYVDAHLKAIGEKTDRMMMEPLLKNAVTFTGTETWSKGASTSDVDYFASLKETLDKIKANRLDEKTVFDMREPTMFYAADITDEQAQNLRAKLIESEIGRLPRDHDGSRFHQMKLRPSPVLAPGTVAFVDLARAFMDLTARPQLLARYKDELHDRDQMERFMKQVAEPWPAAIPEPVFGPSILEKGFPAFAEFQRLDRLAHHLYCVCNDDGGTFTLTITSPWRRCVHRQNCHSKRRHDKHLHRQRFPFNMRRWLNTESIIRIGGRKKRRPGRRRRGGQAGVA